jgi:uncharacterized membrane protein
MTGEELGPDDFDTFGPDDFAAGALPCALVDIDRFRKALSQAQERAREVHETNRATGAEAVSVAFDAGRYDGLSQALAELEKLA